MSWVVWVNIGVTIAWLLLFRKMTRALNKWSDLAIIEMDMSLLYMARATRFAINRVEFGDEEALAWLDAESDEFDEKVEELMRAADGLIDGVDPKLEPLSPPRSKPGFSVD